MNNIKVSIVIPAYNIEDYIGECLRSLKCQTLEEIEVIVIDDGSTDKTGKMAEKYAESDQRFRIIHQSNKGLAQSRNVGLSLAQGKYVGFVDGDDYVSPNAFEQLFLRAEAYSADLVLGSVLYSYEDGTSQRVGDKSAVFQSHSGTLEGRRCFELLLKTGCYIPMVWSNLYRLDLIRQNHLHFEATFHEDEFFMPYALFFAQKVIDINIDFYFYRQRSGSIMHNDKNLSKRSESLFFISSSLKEFIQSKTENKESSGVEQAFLLQADFLYMRAQNIYEKKLGAFSQKCLFIISEEGIAGQYGVGTYINQLIQCFDLSAWNVNVVVLHSRVEEVRWEIKDGIAYYEMPVSGKMRYNSSSLDRAKYYKGVFYYLASRLCFSNEIYCHFNFAIHYDLALLFKTKLQAKIIFTLHYTDWSFDLLGDRTWLKRILENPIGNKDKRLKDAFEREKSFMLECCDYTITIARHSYDMAHQLYEIPLSKLVYIPNGVQDSYRERSAVERQALRAKYGFTDSEKLIVFAGRLDLVKGTVELIEAFKQVLEIIPEVRLIIAGSGNFDCCMEAASPCWKYITFTGFIPHEQLYELYSVANIGIVPSIHEEFGYVAAEMMIHALPVLVNNTTGLKELVEDGKCGVMFDYGENRNIEALKKQIIVLLTRNCELGIQARERILKCFSFQLFTLQIQKIYQ